MVNVNIGIDMGGTRIKMGLVDEEGNLRKMQDVAWAMC